MTRFRLSTRVKPGAGPPARGGVDPPGPGGSAAGAGAGAGSEAGAGNDAGAVAGSPGAVPVPWRVTARSTAGGIEVQHVGAEPLFSVRFALAGGGMLGLSLPRTVVPGERVRVVVRGAQGAPAQAAADAPDAMLVLRWFQSDGVELLWPIAL